MTRDEIIEMAIECGLVGMRPHLDGIYFEALEAFAKLVAQHEREACANVADKFAQSSQYKTQRNLAELVASAIKARGQA